MIQSSRFSRRVMGIIGLGVALPALLLALIGVVLTLRIGTALDAQSNRYGLYMARQVSAAFEEELQRHLMDDATAADIVARAGADRRALQQALEGAAGRGETALFVPLDELADYFLLLVDGQPLIYHSGVEDRAGRRFAGVILRDTGGQVVGSGGWWIDPKRFLQDHLRTVVEERLANDEHLYGGIESRRHISVMLLAPDGSEVARVRTPAPREHAAVVALEGPFEGYSVRIAPTTTAPILLTRRFVWLELGFIAIMAVLILLATFFGLRYTVRQIEIARLKSSFLSNVSHELKTPIALIRLAVETLEMRRISSPEESEKFLRRISRETTRLNQLVENILDFARLEAGQRAFRFTRVDLGEVVRETADSFRLRIEDQGFTLKLDLPEGLPVVRGDGPALAQCLLNLLDNAVKYSRERKTIRVSATTRDGMVGVAVADEGIGIAPRDQRRIFEKFVRLEDGLVHDVKGAGLGLSLVQQIVRAHGGRIDVHSVPHEGST
ncbi:MAG: sensor histidine kinase, partial [Candidatus Eisenbacteria bacterium]